MAVPTEMVMRDGKASEVEEQIKRFRRTYRRRLRKLANLAEPFADLVVSFPAAAFALATDHGTADQRARAFRAVKEGQPLKAVATALALPLWLRKLPPEAFIADLPAACPDGAEVGGQLAGLIPVDDDETGPWFRAVTLASAACDPAFAIWVARHRQAWSNQQTAEAIGLLGIFAWVSEETGGQAGKLLPQRWNPKVGFSKAVRINAAWWRRLREDLFLGDGGLRDPWLAGGRAAGYRFVPLLTLADLNAEGAAMANCVADYAWKMAGDECRLFSIRRGAKHVATVEIRPHQSHEGIPEIVQLLGPDNEDAPHRIWAAAFTWLGKQAAFELPERGQPSLLPPAQAWQRLWKPYWRAVPANPLLPETPDRMTMATIQRHLGVLDHAIRSGA